MNVREKVYKAKNRYIIGAFLRKRTLSETENRTKIDINQ